MTQTDIHFADVFPSATQEGWQKSVEAVLKDKPFQSLISASADNIAIQPLYAAARELCAEKAEIGPYLPG